MRTKDFYTDPRRAASAEVDFGSAWRTQGEGPWKVVWLEDTGELVAFHEAATPLTTAGSWGGGAGDGNFFVDLAAGAVIDIAIEGVVHAIGKGAHKARPEPAEEVVHLGVEPDRARLERALTGWELQMPEPNGLAWVAARCTDAGAHDDG